MLKFRIRNESGYVKKQRHITQNKYSILYWVAVKIDKKNKKSFKEIIFEKGTFIIEY